MKNAKVVIGANFGDEGKGLMTDYFCSQFPSDQIVLNVRFNGGAQAGHTVVTPDGKRHIFGHFGAGSFLPNVATYLGPEFIVNPILFRREWEKLNHKGIIPMVYCHPKCILTMPQDMMVNQFIEKRRGNKRHGSCGVGIYESILRNKMQTSVCIEDVEDFMRRHSYMVDIEYYNFERIEKMTGFQLYTDEKELLINQNIRSHYNDDVRFFMDHVVMNDESLLNLFDNVVFEGAQGLMLDQNNVVYFPHLTPSNTGVENVARYLKGDMDIEVCYATRPYLTRHGAGYLPNECSMKEAGAKVDLTNHENEWQGKLRYGKLDLRDLYRRCKKDFEKVSDRYPKMTFAFTHMDEFSENGDYASVTDVFGNAIITEILDNCDGFHASYGPNRHAVGGCVTF